jgi:hypothetical protein
MLLQRLLSIMDSVILFFLGAMTGSVITIVALALVKGGKEKEVPIVDLEKEKAIKEWEEQSKGY